MDNQSNRVAEKMLNKYFGKFKGQVVDNNDPLNRGRLQVKVKNLMRDVPFWAMPCMPFGGNGMGIFMIPEKDTWVYVEFEGGSLNLPIWTGCYWTDDQSPKDNKTPEPRVRLIKSQKGLTISLDDEDEIVTISDKNNKNSIVIDVNKGKVTITSDTSIVVESDKIQLGSEFAMQPVVLGNVLEAYLTALALAAQAKAPAVPVPTPAMFASFLSTKVKAV